MAAAETKPFKTGFAKKLDNDPNLNKAKRSWNNPDNNANKRTTFKYNSVPGSA